MPTQKIRVANLRREDEEAVGERLRALDGVFFAVASHQEQCVEVDFEDDRASLQEIERVLREMGYEGRLAG